MIQGKAAMTLNDDGVAIYKARLRLAVRRSYAVQVAACVSGALIAWSAARCALDGHYGQSAICTIMLVLAFVTFSYAATEGARARKTLDMLM